MLRELFNGWSLSDKIAAVASAVAFFQFLALVATIWVMRTSTQRQLRAYVGITDIKAENIGGAAAFLLEFRNSGQTPAYSMTVETRVKLADYPLNETLPIVSTRKGVTILGPGDTGHGFVPAGRALSSEELAEMQAGTRAVYVYGEINYIDAFKKKRWTKFRFMIGGNVDIRPEGNMGACEEGNEAN